MRIIWWHTDKAEQWLKDNLNFENWQLMGNGIAVEHRMTDDVIEGLVSDGFIGEQDFTIS